jgi:hypothetical protein
MTKKLISTIVFFCFILPSLLAVFMTIGAGDAGGQAIAPTINPAVPDIQMSQDSVYNYDLSLHENDNADVPVPPLISIVDDSANVYFIQCDGTGGFSPLTYLEDIGEYSRATSVADFDNDGDYDIVAGSSANARYFYVRYFENVGTPTAASFGGSVNIGQFGDATTQSNSWAMDMSVADFNNDGNMDFTTNVNYPYSWVFLGDGNFGFISKQIPNNGDNGRGADAGDVDGDGDDDVVMGSIPGYVYLYTNTNGDFYRTYIGDIGSDPYTTVLADFNNDGLLDIIGDWGSNGVNYLAIGNGDGTFGPFNNINTLNPGIYSASDAYDFNGDGNQDMVKGTYSQRNIWLYPGDGFGAFGTRLLLGSTSGNTLGVGAPNKPIGSQGLTWSASDVDTGLIASIIIDASTDRMTVTSQPGVWGSDDVMLTLTNSLGQSQTQWITITVIDPNGPFIFPPVPDQTLFTASKNLDLTAFEKEAVDYRRDITLSTPTTVADYQVKVVLNTGNFDYSHAKINGGDIRFVSANIPLSYWIESWNYGSTSTLWVKIPTAGTNQFTMKYGDPMATPESDGDATFPFFDDFNDGIIDSVKWPTQSLGGEISENAEELVVTRADPANYIQSPAFSSADLPLVIEARTRTPTIQADDSPWNGWSPVMWYQTNNEGVSILDHASGDNQYIRNDAAWILPASGRQMWDWHTNCLILPGTGTWTASATYETQTASNWAGSWANNFAGDYYIKIGPRHDDVDYNQPMDGRISWVRIREYMAAEPVTTVGAESGNLGSLTWSVSDVDDTIFNAIIIDVPNDILELTWTAGPNGGSDNILLMLTDSDGFTTQQWVTVTVPDYLEIVATSPHDGASRVAINEEVVVVFDQPMNTGTVVFSCTPDPGGWNIIWNADQTTVVFRHNNFAGGTDYTCTISGTSLTGFALWPSTTATWTFTTGASSPTPTPGAEEGDTYSSSEPGVGFDSYDIVGAVVLLMIVAFVLVIFLRIRKKEE